MTTTQRGLFVGQALGKAAGASGPSWVPWRPAQAQPTDHFSLEPSCSGCSVHSTQNQATAKRKMAGIAHYCGAPVWKRPRKTGMDHICPEWCPAMAGKWGHKPALPERGQECWNCGYRWAMPDGTEALHRCPSCGIEVDMLAVMGSEGDEDPDE